MENNGKEKKEKTGWVAELISWVQVLVSAAVIAFVLTTFVIANSEIPTGSMENTIMAGSRVIGSRLHYKFADPERGDVAIFVFGWQCPQCNAIIEGDKQDTCPACGSEVGKRGHTIYYVKRVIGVPGDKVQIKSGLLYVNGELYDTEDTDTIKNAGVAEEEITVGEDEYFVLGDNRNSSEDSRYANIGNIKKEYIKGKAWFVVRPFKKMGRIR